MKRFVPVVNAGELIMGQGDQAVCTLWSPRDRWRKLMDDSGMEYDPERVAVVGNLYHRSGVENLIRNLYANPQMRKLFIVGVDLPKNLISTLKRAWLSEYVTVHVMNPDDSDESLPVNCEFKWIDLHCAAIRDHYESRWSLSGKRDAPERTILTPPKFVCDSLQTPVPGGIFYGKNLREVWDRLRFYIQTFGTQYESRYGNTLEILGMTTVVPESPYEKGLPFSKEEGDDYVQFLLDFNEKPEVSYDYGPLIGGIMDIEKGQFDTRHAYWPVYVPSHRGMKEPPCLVSCWFKQREGVLYGCYVFRSQDMFAGYSRNVYGLHRFQELLAKKHGFECGPLITQTHSAHLYERDVDLDLVSPIITDPAGDCVISVEADHIKVDITRDGEIIQRLEGKTALSLERELRHYVTDVSHALYLGRELYKAELRLRDLQSSVFC